MVEIVRKGPLPDPAQVPEPLRQATTLALSICLREPRPAGFPLLFTADHELIEPAVAFLHEHLVQRAHTAETLRTYAEILYDWFETLEQNDLDWAHVDATDLVAYRNRMMQEVSPRTGRPYRVSTINHRVRGVLRFYDWAVRMRHLKSSPLAGETNRFVLRRTHWPGFRRTIERSFFVLRQYELLPRPFTSEQARELLATLVPPYDLMSRWQLYTGLRLSELAQVTLEAVLRRPRSAAVHHTIEITRKGRKPGYVIVPETLLEETRGYIETYRRAWLERARRRGRSHHHTALFINSRGVPVSKKTYQRVISSAGKVCGFRATTHVWRATFACMLLARLELLARAGAAINPLLVVKILMGHEQIETTDRYLRAIAVDPTTLKEVLDTLLEAGQGT
jgi:site-specific recombinase XerD